MVSGRPALPRRGPTVGGPGRRETGVVDQRAAGEVMPSYGAKDLNKRVSVLGFTGSQSCDSGDIECLPEILHRLFERHRSTHIVTGACIGFDAQVHLLTGVVDLSVKRLVIVPADHKKVDARVMSDSTNVDYVQMPDGTSYRDRNEEIIRCSTVMAGFWTGKRAYNGTFMTLRIADRCSKLSAEDIFEAGILTDEEARYLYYP